MRKRAQKQMLTVLTGERYEPNEQHRRMVVVLRLNDVPNDRIAIALNISRPTLEYYYARELDQGVDALMAWAAERMLFLASQDGDLGVALRATQAVLAPRVKTWREPHVDVMSTVGDISDRTLQQVEADIARLERQRRASATAEGQAAGTDPDQEEPA